MKKVFSIFTFIALLGFTSKAQDLGPTESFEAIMQKMMEQFDNMQHQFDAMGGGFDQAKQFMDSTNFQQGYQEGTIIINGDTVDFFKSFNTMDTSINQMFQNFGMFDGNLDGLSEGLKGFGFDFFDNLNMDWDPGMQLQIDSIQQQLQDPSWNWSNPYIKETEEEDKEWY